jgi:hypothetical protein
MRSRTLSQQNPIPVLLGRFLFSAVVFAQDLPTAKPESVGLSSERLDRISSVVQRDIDDKRIAGAVTLVVRHGKVAWFKSHGMMDREAGKAMPTDAMFRICSMTKPITTVAVMMLYEEGKFLLDDPVSKYLPEFKNSKVLVKPAKGEPYTIPAKDEITIRDLLRHTSGITYQWNEDLGPIYEKANVASGVLPYDGTIGDSVKKLAALPLLPTPVLFWVFTSLELTRMAQPEQKPCALLFVHCARELQGRAVDEPRGHPLHDHPPTQSGKNDMGTRCYLLQVYLRKAARQSGSTCLPWRRHGLRDERAEQAGLDTSLG